MTAGTVGLKCGELPVNDIGVVLMAFGTCQVAAVILRLIRQARMTVVGWCPGIRAVAHAAVLCRIEVTRVLAGRDRAVVTGRTGSKHLIVIDVSDGLPDGSTVAVLANIRRLHVQRTLAGRFGTVMAAEAIVHDIDVVKVRRGPGDRGVTVIAVVAAGDVRRMFAGCRHAVMT